MKLTRRQLYDYRDPTRAEMLLIRAGHHLWGQVKKLRAKNGGYVSERHPLYEALEIIWQAWREVKAEQEIRRAEMSKALKARFRAK